MQLASAHPPSKGLLRWIKRTWRQLKREQLTPGRFGVAVGLGLFFGLSPFWGFQMIAAQVLAHVFKLNRLAVAVGVSISAPPFLPFEVALSVQLGQRILHGRWVPLSMDELLSRDAVQLAKYFGSAFGVGALVLATAVAIPAGLVAAWRLKRSQQNPRPQLSLEQLEALDDGLPLLSPLYRQYVAWKVRLDPIYPMVLPHLLGRREVLDLGAGVGILAYLLRHASPDTQIRCVEWDVKKAEQGKAWLQGRAEVLCGDARQCDLGHPDAIVLLDVLHYVPEQEQRQWLQRCVEALSPGGALILRELDTGASAATAVEVKAVKAGWNRGGGVYPWPIPSIEAALQSWGLEVTAQPAGRGLFRANTLLVARKRP